MKFSDETLARFRERQERLRAEREREEALSIARRWTRKRRMQRAAILALGGFVGVMFFLTVVSGLDPEHWATPILKMPIGDFTLFGIFFMIAMFAFVGALHIVIGFTMLGLFTFIGKLWEWYDNRGDK